MILTIVEGGMKVAISIIVFMLIYQFCGIALCSDSELKPKEFDFTYENYLTGLKLLEDSIRQCEKDRNDSWEATEIGIPNALIGIEGYVLKLRKENIRLELENARLRKDRNALDKAMGSLKQIEEEIKKFLDRKTYAD